MQTVELGSLRRIDAREVWKHEAQQFTPWLKQHIGLLGEALGIDLDLVEREVAVGPFAADLVAKDVASDRWVVIENQLGPTDHSHLGQLVTYGAGTEASVFVWISPEFRDEHRAALDWLNEHSDDESLFFGVAMELIAVDDSLPAPNFRLVSFPNEWRKTTQRARGPASGKSAAYAQFFGELLKEFKLRYPGETTASIAPPQNWLSISVGRTGFSTGWSFTAEQRFRVELYIDVGDGDANATIFDQLQRDRPEIEASLGHQLDWDEISGRRACRISSYYRDSPVSVLDGQETLDLLKSWAADEMKRLRDAFRSPIQKVNAEVPAAS